MIQNPLAASMVQKPMQSAALNMNPQMALPEPPKNALMQAIGGGLDSFRKSFDPEGYKAGKDEAKVAEGDKLKQTLALMQQQRALPEAQRGQWWQQNAPTISKIIGQDVSQMPLDVTKFSDDALDGKIAALSAQAGIGPVVPEPMTAYQAAVLKQQEEEGKRPQGVNLGGGAYAEYDPTAPAESRLRMLQTPDAKPADLPEGMWYGQDGKGPPQPIPGYVGMRTQIARGSQSPSASADTYRPATPEDRAKWGLPPEGAFKINERTGEPAAISGARAAQDFSQTEIRGFRDQADGLYILKNAVNQYVTMLEKMGGPQVLDTPLNAENTQALKSAHGLITEAIKDAGKLGALDQGVQNLVNAIIQEPVGWGTFGKSTESIKQAANQLNSSIEFKLSRVPEEYRAGSTGAVPDFGKEDDEDNAFLDKLFGRFEEIAGAAPPSGVDPEDWKFFTPEMKQQFMAGRGQ
jgi:hypothetical protein